MGCNCSGKKKIRHIVTEPDNSKSTQNNKQTEETKLSLLKQMWEDAKAKDDTDDNSK